MSCYRIKIRTGDGEDNYEPYQEPEQGEEPYYFFHELDCERYGVLIRAYEALHRDNSRKVTIEKFNDDCSKLLSETYLTKS